MSLFESPRPSGGEDDAHAPLAERMRPRELAEVEGQTEVLDAGRALRSAIEAGKAGSLLLWGPPGVGKTTLARIIAKHSELVFEPFSAVLSGVKEVRAAVDRAQDERRMSGRGTLLFVDEIHRFNKAQQDAFLPHVEVRGRSCWWGRRPRIRRSRSTARCCRGAGSCVSRRSATRRSRRSCGAHSR